MFAIVIALEITFSLKIAISEDYERLRKETSNQLKKPHEIAGDRKKSAEDRRRLKKFAEDRRRNFNRLNKFAEDRTRRRRS